MTKQQFKEYINGFDFINLFNHFGWAFIKEITPIKIDADLYNLQSIAEKSGFRILICQADKKGNIPEYPIRLKIHNQLSRLFKEHLIIFINKQNTQQTWQTIQREIAKPAKLSIVNWTKGQEPELLFQKTSGLLFTLDEEDNITIVDVTKRVADNFSQNNEKVTKQFYDRFKQQHSAFLKFIKGIEDKVNQEWYASLMLNRLMFCYFIQKKGFLDNNKNYLTDKLKECQNKKGKNKFYSFYRNFLLSLFHEGLGAPEHSKELEKEIGTIPYLNGGLFDTHEIEKDYKDKIEIDDKAFESIFKFFDEWEWHLDTRHTASGRDINPDVIGYIFEKYINDRADMGAYYTKEDITDYISKNCILPFLFDETKRHLPKAFKTDGVLSEVEVWQLVKQSGDKYIYDAVKHGINLPSPLGEGSGVRSLPREIAEGIKNVSARNEWNKPAPPDYALPTEIWREVVERRQRYAETKKKIEAGEVNNINDFITYNLNIRQFAQDVIENTNDAELVKEFYKALTNATILDPTCGSGAFLFAAMNILEPLYVACITRMRGFTEDEDRRNKEEKKTFSHKYKFFREVLQNIQSEQHPNLDYFIYKTIILRNLYGVDIMNEAVEIAKLRLFLKLVATVEADYRKPNLGLEPLPDIDFNIRAGNTLVGFATDEELKKGLRYTLDGIAAAPAIEEKCDIVAKAFSHYKEIQLSYGDDYKEFKKAKDDLNKRLKELNHDLNLLLYKQSEGLKYESWLKSYKPFHWFAEFYEIIHDKEGFDVVIGNPPYVEYSKIKKTYTVKDYHTEPTGNLYAFVCERSNKLLKHQGYFGFIVPIAIVSVAEAESIRNVFKKNNSYLWTSNFAIRPAKLFEGVEQRLTIVLGLHRKDGELVRFSTKYHQWYVNERRILFQKLLFCNSSSLSQTVIPKINSQLEVKILEKIQNIKPGIIGEYLVKQSKAKLFFHRTPGYWIRMMDFQPFFKSPTQDRSIHHIRELSFSSKEISDFAGAVGSSSMFFFWFFAVGNCRNLTLDDLKSFPIGNPSENTFIKISNLFNQLMIDFKNRSSIKNRGNTSFQEFDWGASKPIIDKIDGVLGAHYGFTEEELDFIINYDIKYRMGKELESEEA